MSPSWLKACGKSPRNAPVPGSICSGSSPRGLARALRESNSSMASSSRPCPARLSTSQKLQSRNAPSRPGSPSGDSPCTYRYRRPPPAPSLLRMALVVATIFGWSTGTTRRSGSDRRLASSPPSPQMLGEGPLVRVPCLLQDEPCDLRGSGPPSGGAPGGRIALRGEFPGRAPPDRAPPNTQTAGPSCEPPRCRGRACAAPRDTLVSDQR
jgi:hypothetical protein